MSQKPIGEIARVELRLAPGKEEFIIHEKGGRSIHFGQTVDKPHCIVVQENIREAVNRTNTIHKELNP